MKICRHHWLVSAKAVDGAFPAHCRRCGAQRTFAANATYYGLADQQRKGIVINAKRAHLCATGDCQCEASAQLAGSFSVGFAEGYQERVSKGGHDTHD